MGAKTKTRYTSMRGTVWKFPAGSSLTTNFVGSVLQTGYSRTGGNLPNYKFYIKKGLYAGNGLSVAVSNVEATDLISSVVYRKSANPNSPDYYVRGGSFGVSGVVPTVNTPAVLVAHIASSSMVKAREIAIRQLQRNFTARRRQFQGGVFAGELMKTIGMVTRPASSLRSKAAAFTRRLRNLRTRWTGDRNSWTKVVADTWLETVFGWKPLLSDVRDGALALARVATRDALQRQQFRCYGEDVNPVTTTVHTYTAGLDPFNTVVYRGSRSVTNRSECILYGVWSTKLVSPTTLSEQASRLAQLSGLSWEDVPSQAWELIPWSFVVDYFSNVGDCIEAAANTEGGPRWVAEVQAIQTTRQDSANLSVPDMITQLGGLYWYSDDSGSQWQSSYRTVTRGLYTGALQPVLRFRLPVDMQWLNLAALVAGGNSLQPFLKK